VAKRLILGIIDSLKPSPFYELGFFVKKMTNMEMTVCKHKKDGKLYVLHAIESPSGKKFIAMAYRHDGKPLVGCDPKDFAPANTDKK